MEQDDASSLLYGDIFSSWEQKGETEGVSAQKDDEQQKVGSEHKIDELERKENLFIIYLEDGSSDEGECDPEKKHQLHIQNCSVGIDSKGRRDCQITRGVQ